MTPTSIRFKKFIESNQIVTYHLPKEVKKSIAHYWQTFFLYQETPKELQQNSSQWKGLEDKDQQLLRTIKGVLIEKVKSKATDDIEILAMLKKVRWTKNIQQKELRAMGLTASLFWNTTILGKLKLVRPDDFGTHYFIVPIGKQLTYDPISKEMKITNGKPTPEREDQERIG
ncbi:hypothetical protein [Aquimarina pacifica]|uniref:hypothetical protein n=1 Tax=Aquimarina pacifica TaxID=1296415 RepID=UPI0004708A97|nr:hypothetical protein [Aquimarina pacifica]